MSRRRFKSLAAKHPWRLDVPLLLSISLVLLAQGLTRPVMEIRALIFWRDQYSIISNIENFYHHGKTTAAVVLTVCSVVYPAFKILALFFLWLAPMPAVWRRLAVRSLRLLGRWSMLDVLTVAAIVVGSRVIGPLDARPLPGIYVYAASIFVLTVTTILMDRLARNGRKARI